MSTALESAAERDFSTFKLGDNVYELAGGIIPEIAEHLRVDISPEPTSEDIQNIMGGARANQVLRENVPITAIDRDEMIDMVVRSGIQQPLNRSLWTPSITPHQTLYIDNFVISDGMANWQDRTATLLINQQEARRVHVLGGNRVMDTATEKVNPNIIALHAADGEYPTGATYISRVIMPRLVKAGLDVYEHHYATTSADQMFSNLFAENQEILDGQIGLARVANAGLIMAVQLRTEARKFKPDFDADPSDPQLFVVTDSFGLAWTDEQEKQPQHYQKSSVAFTQLLLTAKKLHEAAGGQ